jgi:hypothetical protein
MPKKEIEKIVLAGGDKKEDGYCVAIGLKTDFYQRGFNSLDTLKGYLLGLIDSGKYVPSQVKNIRINEPADYFYIGLPLKRKEFQEVKDCISQESNHDGNWC